MKRIIYAVMLLLGLSIVGCQKEGEDVKVSSISLNMTSVSLTAGSSATLVATISPSNATNQKVIWMTNNASVATVNKGTVTAIAEGDAIITAVSDDSGATATCTVTVTKSGTGPDPYVPTSSPKVSRIIWEFEPGGHDMIDFYYDDKGRLESFVTDIGKSYIEYDFSSYLATITWPCNDGSKELIKFRINSDGLCTEFPDDKVKLTYRDNHLIKIEDIERGNYYSNSWKDECIISTSFYDSGNSTEIYTYHYSFYDNPLYGMPSDPIFFFCGPPIEEFQNYCALCLWGRTNKKLLKEVIYEGDVVNKYDYVFDDNNRLREIINSFDDDPFHTHIYLSYDDETKREPREEVYENPPADLVGHWIATGYVDNGIEKSIDYSHSAHIITFSSNSYYESSVYPSNGNTIILKDGVLWGGRVDEGRYNYPYTYIDGKIYETPLGTGWYEVADVSILSKNRLCVSHRHNYQYWSCVYHEYDEERGEGVNYPTILERVKEFK